MGQIGECIVSDKLHGLVPQSFATSYLVHSNEDVRILHELVSAHGEPHPAVIVYPQCETLSTVDENLTFLACQWLVCKVKFQQLPMWSLIALAPLQVCYVNFSYV